MTSEAEFIRQAKLDWDDEDINTIEDALEAHYGNGSYDDTGGDVEAPTGHYYRIDRWILVTDSHGVKTVLTFETDEKAEDHFQELEDQFDDWDTEENE